MIRDEPTLDALSIRDVAKRLGISLGTAYRGARLGDLPTVRVSGRLLVPREALERLLREGHSVKNTPEWPAA